MPCVTTKKKKFIEYYTFCLHDLNKDQGKILIKVISRQSGRTLYSILKEYGSVFKAMRWQKGAILYGMNLKSVYDRKADANVLIEKAIENYWSN